MDPEPENKQDTQQKPPAAEPAPTTPPAAAAAEGLPQVNLEARLKELENFLSERDKEITELKKNLEAAQTSMAANGAAEAQSKKALQDKEAALADRDKALSTVLSAYRGAIMQAHPDIPEEMVTGSTLEELQGNLAKAKVLVKKIREKAPQTTTTVPAGAPVRTGPDLSALSPRDKIVHGLKGNGR